MIKTWEHDVMGMACASNKLLSLTTSVLVIINLLNAPDFNELHIIKTALMLFSH